MATMRAIDCPLGNHGWVFAEIDQFPEERDGRLPRSDPSSPAHGGIPIHVKPWYGREKEKLVVLRNLDGNQASDELVTNSGMITRGRRGKLTRLQGMIASSWRLAFHGPEISVSSASVSGAGSDETSGKGKVLASWNSCCGWSLCSLKTQNWRSSVVTLGQR